jgi:hypothetical protein
MAYTPIHGKSTVLKIGANDISSAAQNSTLSASVDIEKSTGYGATNHTKVAGIVDGQFTANGVYDIGATTGTNALIDGKEGTTVTVTRQVAGAGSGKPQEVFTCIFGKIDISDPYDGLVQWSLTWEITGAVNRTAQP